MSIAARVWLVLALVYAAFFSWYTSFGGPLTEEEIAHFTTLLEGLGDDPDRMQTWIAFMESDTGDDFAMFNAVHLRDTPTPGPGIEPGETSEEVMLKYGRPFLSRAFRRASHPVLAGTAAARPIDIWGIEGAEEWSQGALVRYRSRRDLLEHVESLGEAGLGGEDGGIHRFKIAALEKTIAYPLDPWFQLGDPRLLLALILAIVGLSVQAFSRRPA